MQVLGERPRVLIVGGGYVGMFVARRLQRKLRPEEAELVLVEPRNYMTYQPFLPEAAAGSLEPRHVLVPLRRVLHRVRVLTGDAGKFDLSKAEVTVQPASGDTFPVWFDHLVVAVGSVSRLLPIPGLAECGIGFKTIEEAIALRNHVLGQLDLAETTPDPEARRCALTFVLVGGGFAGIEALGELEDMTRVACRYYPSIRPEELRWVLVEATDRILPEVGEEMGRQALRELEERGIDVRLKTKVESAVNKRIQLSDGSEFLTSTLIWTAGVKPNPVLAEGDLPLDEKGRLLVGPDLRVAGTETVWSAGDCAAVPDLANPGATTPPNAQHAVRQARRLADNIVATLRDRPVRAYAHRYAGSVATLGLHKGVARVYGTELNGMGAWLLHRAYHLSQMPTVNRKLRIGSDWALASLFQRELISLGELHEPREEFEEASAGVRPR